MPEHCSDRNPFNSSNQFCFGGRAYDKCGGREYNPSTQGCVGGTVRNVWTLTVDRNSTAGGTVTPSSPQSRIFSGTPVNITATPANGYLFINWTVVSGTAVFGNAERLSTTVTLSSNATIRANFEQIFTLTVNRDPTVGGSVTPSSLRAGIIAGTPVTITATPASGYTFVNWTLTSGTAAFGNANNANTTVTLSSNATIRANFQLIPTHTLTVNRDPTAGGTVTPASSQSGITAGTPVNISATANSGYRFVNWTVTSGTATFGNANSASTTVTLSSSATIRANFQLISTHTLTVTRDPAVGGTVTPSSSQSGITAGTPVSISAVANSDYQFVNWTVVSGTAAFGNANSASTTVTLSSNATIRANFQQIFRYTLTVARNPTEGGTVTPSFPQSSILAGTAVNISASANSGYTFVNWTVTGGPAVLGNANSASTSVTVRGNVTVTANFRQLPGGQFNPNIIYGSFADSRDGRNYRTIMIGTRIWMAENLNFAADGSICYDNNPANCAVYGRLYDWATVMGFEASCNSSSCANLAGTPHQGICPPGWHVPIDEEWQELIRQVDPNAIGSLDNVAGSRLKSRNGWFLSGSGTDEFGFSALPGGGSNDGSFWGGGSSGFWWSATEDGAGDARYRDMQWQFDNVDWYWGSKAGLFSLRCLQDVSP
jgi:uncharacterized protein (TIGR02145 family)